MQTTAGSLAMYGNHVPGDAVIIQQLRAAGAIILAKSNLGEWANFRDDEAETYPLAVGWSARDGSTNNAYDLSYTSWGSSSGSANGAAANLCAAAIGTETDGSITGPSAVENIVGLKPTLGLVSQDGIIPIAHEQDTAGPMARSVTDIAILLGVLQSPFGEVIGHDLPSDYTQFLDPNALDGAVIGRDVRFFDYSYYGSGIPGDELTVAFAENAMSVMERHGTSVVDAIVAPHLANATGPAVAGYPNLSIPVGIRDSGRPAGMLMYSTFLHEPQLIGFGYALEQALNVRQQPQFLGSIIPIPNGGFCTGHQNHGQPHLPHGRIF